MQQKRTGAENTWKIRFQFYLFVTTFDAQECSAVNGAKLQSITPRHLQKKLCLNDTPIITKKIIIPLCQRNTDNLNVSIFA